MKSLRESLFDTDLVTKKVGHVLCDDVILRMTSVHRERGMTAFKLKGDNGLVAIDWSKVNKDVKEYGGSSITFGPTTRHVCHNHSILLAKAGNRLTNLSLKSLGCV